MRKYTVSSNSNVVDFSRYITVLKILKKTVYNTKKSVSLRPKITQKTATLIVRP